jgi:hypothetical protein
MELLRFGMYLPELSVAPPRIVEDDLPMPHNWLRRLRVEW